MHIFSAGRIGWGIQVKGNEKIMTVNSYKPEGMLMTQAENREMLATPGALERAMLGGKILEGMAVLCDSKLSLHVDLGCMEGIIPRNEALWCRPGEEIKDIAVITRVGKAVCFKVIGFEEEGGRTRAVLSRRAAQRECIYNHISALRPGDIIPARVTHLEPFGAFVDIGCGIPSLLSVDCISVSRISHPRDRFSGGAFIPVVVKQIDRTNDRIFVSHRELLGTWEENAARFSPGQTVAGIIRSIESYGIFIELSPNLAGLAELRDSRTPSLNLTIGCSAAVYIKSIIPERMKVKLVLIDTYSGPPAPTPPRYYIDPAVTEHIDRWRYSPPNAPKVIESVFSAE